MKKLLIILCILLAYSCDTEEQLEYSEVTFQAAYPTDYCMGTEPSYILIQFKYRSFIVPVKEINTGIVATETFRMLKGNYILNSITVYNSIDEIVAYGSDVFDDTGYILKVTPAYVRIEQDNMLLGNQVVCKGWKLN